MQQIIFIQGGGDTGYQVDARLVDSLAQKLGGAYSVLYPEIKPDKQTPDFGWTDQLAGIIAAATDNTIVVAHSFGASLTLKYLSQNTDQFKIKALFCIATPYWEGSEEWEKPLMLDPGFADKLPTDLGLYFYHCKDDQEIPFANFEKYKAALPQAVFRGIAIGGHQLGNDLSIVAKDIKLLS